VIYGSVIGSRNQRIQAKKLIENIQENMDDGYKTYKCPCYKLHAKVFVQC